MPRNVVAPKTSRFVLMASICVVVAALYFAQDVLIPLALAMLLSFLLAPIVSRIERFGIRRVGAVLITVSVVFTVIGILGYMVWTQVYDLADNLDKYSGNIVAKVDQIRPGGGGIFSKFRHTVQEVQERVDQPEKAATTQATQPGDKATNLLASEMAARSGTPRVLSEKDKLNPAAGGYDPAALIPTTQYTRENPLPVGVVPAKQSPLQELGQYAGFILGPLGTLGIVIVFVIFMLLQREDLRNRLIRLTAPGGQLTIATTALDDASSRVSRYLLAQAIVNGTYGIAIALGLWLIGLILGRHDASGTSLFPNVVLWGLLCAVLRFIPYIGPWIGAAFPLLIALAVYKGFGVFVGTILLFVVIELVSNNFMEPWLYSSSTGMSTVAILVSAVFWTWLWGAIGLLLSTPLTVVLVVLGKYVPQLQFLDVLLGDEPVLDPPTRVYQRLLALDAEEAMELVEQYLDETSLEAVYDTVLLPAMSMAEQDRHKGLLDDRRQTFIRHSMREMIEELGDQARIRIAQDSAEHFEAVARGEKLAHDTPPNVGGNGKSSAASSVAASSEDSTAGAGDGSGPAGKSSVGKRPILPKNCTINVVCLPAHDEADEIANLMLAQLLELRGYCAVTVSQNALASEMIEKVESSHADAVVVSALPPAAVAHARYLCKRVHARVPDAKLAVGLWTFRGNLGKAKERITCVGSVQLVTTLAEMQESIDQLAQPAMLRGEEGKTKKEKGKTEER